MTTVLRDVGLDLERIRLAQITSEKMIESLVSKEHIQRYSDVSIGDFVRSIDEWGRGLYLVGLDRHTGFISSIEEGVFFIHSSYLDPYCVIKEEAMESRILASSGYRVVGKISADDDQVLIWLTGD